jgi:hypothetical protein
MRPKLALLTTALAFGLGTTAALAEDAPGAKSDITIVESNPSAGDAASNGGAMNQPSDTAGAPTAPEKSGSAQPQQVPGADVPDKGASATPGAATKGNNM